MLVLQSHDFPHDGDELKAYRVTEAIRHGERWQIGLGATTRRGRRTPRVVVCQKEGAPTIYLTYTSKLALDRPSRMMEINEENHSTAFELRMSFAYAMKSEKWARGLFLNEHLQLRQHGEEARFFLLLSPHGWGFWRGLISESAPPYIQIGSRSEFIWSQSNEKSWLLGATDTELLDRITHQLREPSSDSAFALQFASLSLAERRKLLWPCKRGDTEKMESVLRQALLSQEKFWDLESRGSWNLDLKGWEEKDRYDNVHISHMNGRRIAELDGAFHQVFDFFSPQRNDELIGRHLCLQRNDFSHICIEAESPSLHERLEASIEWHSWRTANYSDQH